MHHIAPPVSKYFCIMRTFGDYKIEKQIFSSIRLFISTPNAEAKEKLQKDFIYIALPVALGMLPNSELLTTEVASFWLRHPATAVAPPGLVPSLKIFIAALISLSSTKPQEHLCVRTERLFLTIKPQPEQI